MTKAGKVEFELGQVAQTHDSLLEVLVGNHQPQSEEIGSSVAQEGNASVPVQEYQMALGVAWRCG